MRRCCRVLYRALRNAYQTQERVSNAPLLTRRVSTVSRAKTIYPQIWGWRAASSRVCCRCDCVKFHRSGGPVNQLKSERWRQVGDRQDQPTFDCRIAIDREFQKLNLGKDERLATLGAKRVQEFLDASPEIRMNVESVKDRQPFALTLAAISHLT